MTARRFTHLECARGIASIIVLLHHFVLAFYPSLKANIRHGGLQGSPLFLLINGAGSVIFFFVLSGFVLTRSMYENPSWNRLASAVLKRLPRLILPAGISLCLGMLILKYGGNAYVTAGKLSQSMWLQSFAYGEPPGGFVPGMADALRQSLLIFLLPGHAYYNSNLWTMVHEFKGSLMVFGIIAVYRLCRAWRLTVMLVLHLALLAYCYVYYFYGVSFIGGSLIAYLSANRRYEIHLHWRVSLALLLIAVIGFSFSNGPFDTLLTVDNTIASLSLMVVLVFNPTASRVLSGRFAALLGQISFPLYLVSTLVILSASSRLYIVLSAHSIAGLPLLLILLPATLIISLLVCLPLLAVDAYWVRFLNAIMKTGFSKRRAEQRSAFRRL